MRRDPSVERVSKNKRERSGGSARPTVVSESVLFPEEVAPHFSDCHNPLCSVCKPLDCALKSLNMCSVAYHGNL